MAIMGQSQQLRAMHEMTNSTLTFEENSCAGPIDMEVLAWIEKRHALDASYRTLIHEFHGGIPVQQFIKGKGNQYRIGRFLTILQLDSPLPEPFQPHFDQSDIDCRIARCIPVIIDSESSTSRALLYGERLLPFAAFYAGENHPDEMCLDRGYVSFLCFDYGTKGPRPPIVVWHAAEAMDAVLAINEDGDEQREVDYDAFTEFIADNFDEFLALLHDF